MGEEEGDGVELKKAVEVTVALPTPTLGVTPEVMVPPMRVGVLPKMKESVAVGVGGGGRVPVRLKGEEAVGEREG